MLKKFVLGSMVVVAALLGNACGDDGSSESPAGPADSEVTLSSSSICEGCDESSSSVTPKNVTLSEAEGSSSSETGVSSSSTKDSILSFDDTGISSSLQNDKSSSSAKSSSSSAKVEDSSSSAKVDESSSSMKAAESSSSVKVEESSSSEKNEVSSSSEKPVESSSSEKVEESSSSEKSSSSSAKSSSSVESSSSETKPSSSEKSSSSEEQNSSSSLESTGICKTKTEDNCVYGTLYDERDGKTYKTIKIGEQEWMAENLNYYVDVVENTSYSSFCEKDSALCSKYGRHYTWAAAIDSISLYAQYSILCGVRRTCTVPDTIKIKGVCPSGWHLPKQKEWQKLINFVGASNAGEILKSFTDWENWPGTDLYGFSVLPAGFVHNASIYSRGKKSYLWTSTDHDNFSAQCAQFNYSEVRKDVIMLQTESKSAVEALPVRCIKD